MQPPTAHLMVIEIEPGQREICRYRPRDSKEADGKLRFYAEIKGQWHVVTVEAVRPRGGRFVDDAGNDVPSPFSDSPPKEITHCRLLAPPVYEDENHAKQNRPENWPEYLPHIPEDRWGWESVYQETHGEDLWPKPEHEGQPRGPKSIRKGGPIRNMLARIRWAARADRRRDMATREQETRRRSEAPLEELKYTSEEQRQERVKESRQQIEAARNHWRQIETLSLADFKRGCWDGEGDSPLHSFLVSEWAEKSAVDPAAMQKDAAACREWIKTHCRNVTAIVQHHESGLGGLREIKPELVPDRWDFFDALLARVRHKVTFRNEAVLYLMNCETREPSKREREEIEGTCPETNASLNNVEHTTAKLERIQSGIDDLKQGVAAVRVNTEAIAKNEYELRQENAELRELAKNGFLRFATRVEADDFRAFAAIMLTGNRNQAAQALDIPQRSFYDLVETWRSRGPDYKRMYRMADWRKKSGRKIKVRLDDSLLGTEIEDQAENPETIRAVLAAMRDKTDGQSRDDLLRDILQAMDRQNAQNWPHVQSEVIGLLKEELSQ